MKEKLIVDIEGKVIDAGSLPEWMESFSSKKDFAAHHYYRAAKENTSAKTLKQLGEVNLSLIHGESDFPKKIAMVRSTGMVIYEKHFRSIVPYAGVFFCENEEGNKKLSSMEPPRHDEWDKDRPEPRANGKTLNELYDWLKQEIRAIKSTDEGDVTDIPDDYKKLMPDDEESEFSNAENDSENDKTENPEQTPKKEISFTQVKPKKEKKPNPSPKPNPDSARFPIKSRIFLVEPETNTYKAVLTPEKTGSASVRISAVGDDAKPVPVKVVKAWIDGSEKFTVDEKGIIQDVNLSGEKTVKIHLQIDSADRLSLEASANET